MFTKEDWEKWKQRGECLRYTDQYKTKSRRVFKVAPKYEGYLFIPEKDFKRIKALYNFYQKNCDFYQEKYEIPIGRKIFDKNTQQYQYMLTKDFIAKEIIRTKLPIILDLARRLGNFTNELLKLEVEHDKFIDYLLRLDKNIKCQEILDDESLYI